MNKKIAKEIYTTPQLNLIFITVEFGFATSDGKDSSTIIDGSEIETKGDDGEVDF